MEQGQIEIRQSLFFSSVSWSLDLSKIIDNEPLIDYAYELSDTEDGTVVSNRLGFHSNYLPLNPDTIDTRFKPLYDQVQSALFDISSEKIYESTEDKIVRTDAWVNINTKYAYNMPHIHGGEVLLSAVYYAQVPQDSGDFYFVDDSIRSDIMKRLRIDKFLPFGTKIQFLPAPGSLIVFPGWIRHGVEQNLSDQDRISFAFNFSVRFDDNSMGRVTKGLNNEFAY